MKHSKEQKFQLGGYYEKVWSYINSGEIQLKLDLHFSKDGQKYVVDFRSGFGSNGKENLNRLLLAATVYMSLDENYKCMLSVRVQESNGYFITLKNSDVWMHIL
jgi:hypothetical protein